VAEVTVDCCISLGELEMIVDERTCVVLGLCLMAEQTNFGYSCADLEKKDRQAVSLDQLFLVLGD
jgi:ferredoxin